MEASPPPPAAVRCWSAILQNPPPPKPQEAPIVNRVFSESCRSSKGISVAVVDANAIIHGGEKLMSYADKLVSVKEVLEEVRDPVSRHRLAFMPFSVDAMEPSPDALKKGELSLSLSLSTCIYFVQSQLTIVGSLGSVIWRPRLLIWWIFLWMGDRTQKGTSKDCIFIGL